MLFYQILAYTKQEKMQQSHTKTINLECQL